MDLERHEVCVGGREVRLTTIEFRLLQALMEFPGRVFTRDQLLGHVYAFHESAVVDRTVDVHIGKVREKLGDDPAQPRFIATVRGVGYKLAGNDRAGWPPPAPDAGSSTIRRHSPMWCGGGSPRIPRRRPG